MRRVAAPAPRLLQFVGDKALFKANHTLRHMENSLHLALILLAAAVLVVILFRLFKLPAMIGYLLVGIVIGPYGLGLIPDTAGTRNLAEIGVVFLMFSIGLEFSLAKLTTMRRIVFGLGASQVALTLAGVV